MNNPKISLIVPVYNVEKYLNRCVDSILSQDFTDFEILLIDDGSMDKSGKICDEYAKIDTRVRVFHKVNGGVSSARNLGLDYAKGQWIGFCDSDDYVKKDFLKTFFTLGDDCEMLSQGFCCPNWFGKEEKMISEKTEVICGDHIADYVLKTSHSTQIGYIWCKLFLREIIVNNNIRFDNSTSFMEDRLFVYKYLGYVDKIINLSYDGYIYQFPPLNKSYGQQDIIGLQINLLNCLMKINGYSRMQESFVRLMLYQTFPMICDSRRLRLTSDEELDCFFSEIYRAKRILSGPYLGKRCMMVAILLGYFYKLKWYRNVVLYLIKCL